MPSKKNPYDQLPAETLETLKSQIEGFDTIERIDPDLREFVERRWPELLSKFRTSPP